jgi:Ferredoxin subunits of nitrite reductase and ring-hydroxylating dioxygenases
LADQHIETRCDPETGLPLPGQMLCHVRDVRDAVALGLEYRVGDREARIILVQTQKGVVGYINRCPHARAPLDWVGGKFLNPDGTLLRCALHGALFILENGRCVSGPCRGQSLMPFPVVAKNDAVYAGMRVM